MRIVFASIGSLGDLHPALALASACRDRGHTPIIAAPSNYAEYITKLGFTFRPIRPDFDADMLIELFSHPRMGSEILMRDKIFPRVRETYEDLLAASQDADFIVAGELVYVVPLIAAKLSLPWANAILSPLSFLSVSDPCVMPNLPEIYPLRHLGTWPYRLVFTLARIMAARWTAPLLALQRELGLPDGGNIMFEGKFSPHLVLTMFPNWFAQPQPDWPSHVVQTGFPFFNQPGDPEMTRKIEAFLAAGEPPIVFTLGSTAVNIARDFYQTAAETAQKLGRRAVLLIGKNPAPDMPSDQVLSLSYAPLGPLFKGAAVVVHHGGIGSCAEVLQAGPPALVIPFAYDQPDNAERLKRLGVARALPKTRISRDSLFNNLQTLLADTTMQAKAREISQRIDPTRDFAKSVDAIEQAALSKKR